MPGWYLAEAQRGQQLLDRANVEEAIGVFEALLARLGGERLYERAAILERLGLCFHLSGRPDLAAARLRRAMSITQTLASSDGVRALRGTLHAELGDVLRSAGEIGDARRAYEAALEVAAEQNDLRAQSLDLMRLGDLALLTGAPEEAGARHSAALQLLQRQDEPALEAAARHQLGRTLQGMGRLDEAGRHYLEAARLREARGNLAGAAQDWGQLAIVAQEAGDPGAAEAWHRKAIDAVRQTRKPLRLAAHLCNLAALLAHQPGRLDEARRLTEEGLRIGQAVDPTSLQNWKHYGVLATIIEAEAAILPDRERRVELKARVRAYRQVEQHAPRIVTALARLEETPSYSRAVIFERLGQCFGMGGRADLAVECLREAIAVAEKLERDDQVSSLRRMLYAGLAETVEAAGAYAEANKACEEALRSARETGDVLGEAAALTQLGGLALSTGDLEPAWSRYRAALRSLNRIDEPALRAIARHGLDATLERMRGSDEIRRHAFEATHLDEQPDPAAVARDYASDFEATVFEELITEHVLEPDLLLDGPRERRIVRVPSGPDPLRDTVRPMLAPCARTLPHEAGAVRVCLAPEEPMLTRHPGCIVMRRTRREVVVPDHSGLLWRLVRDIDGRRTVAEILGRQPSEERAAAGRMLALLGATEALDVSGRPFGRFLHTLTKKGVLPGGGLEKDEVMRLAMDGSYRAYPGARTLPVSPRVPDRLRGFHALTRARRSQREYLGLALARQDFDALLNTGCGATGTVAREGREVRLRAYPSSGALYAVEIYPVVFAVEGLEPAVYRYRAVDNVLEEVRSGLDPGRIVGAMLPVERGMVAGAAAMICLTGFFLRHEHKYGQGGYRMMIAEAGHLSQNLILAATALGLCARPFGGVFDSLLNRELGIDEAEEQFLLAVLVGRPEARDRAEPLTG